MSVLVNIGKYNGILIDGNGVDALVAPLDASIDISPDVLRIIIAVLENRHLNTEFIDFVSYKALYDAILLCDEYKLGNVLFPPTWFTTGRMIHCEYIHLLEERLGGVVNMDEYISMFKTPEIIPEKCRTIVYADETNRSNDVGITRLGLPVGLKEFKDFNKENPWDFIPNIIKMDISISKKIDVIFYYSKYNINHAFNANDTVIQQRIKTLNKQLLEFSDNLIVDPFDNESNYNYFKFQPNTITWKCNVLSRVREFEPNEHTLNTYEDALNNLHKFSYGFLNADFPWENVVIAGGCISRVLDKRYTCKNSRQADVDIFIIAKTPEERLNVYKNLIEHFKSPRTYYCIRGSVTTVYIVDVMRKFQIVSDNSTNIYDLISRFDLGYLQWAFSNGRFYGTSEAFMAFRHATTTTFNAPRTKINRLIKALYCGFNINPSAEVQSMYDIGDIIKNENNAQVKKIIRDFHKYYYPQSNQAMDEKELNEHHIAMIESDSHSNIITQEISQAVNNMHLGGIFNNNYEILTFKNFDINNIVNHVLVGAQRYVVLMAKSGPIRITSDIATITDIKRNDENFTLNLTISEEFSIFCNMLCDVVFKLYSRQNIDKRLCVNNNLSLEIPEYKINNQEKYGISLLKNHHGSPLNLEEDLHAGDNIQFMFKIGCSLGAKKFINIDVVKMIRYESVGFVDNAQSEDIQPVVTGPAKIQYQSLTF
jgi:hypothetical protein